MNRDDLNPLERKILQNLRTVGSLTISTENALEVAQSFGTTTQQLAAAKNNLKELGYIAEEVSTFTGGACVIRLNREQPTTPKKMPKKLWWKWLQFWRRSS
jgi:hypothetical protein